MEKAIAKELASIKRPRKEQRFGSCPPLLLSVESSHSDYSELPNRYAMQYAKYTGIMDSTLNVI